MSSAFPLSSPIEVEGTGGSPGQIDFSDGTNVVEVKAPSGLTGTVNFTLPPNTGTTNQVLRTSGTGVTSWIYDTGPYEAIVDAGGEGDYLTPSAAFIGGATSVFVKNGMYPETVDVNVPSGGSLVGESIPGVVISFGGAALGIKVDGNGGTTYSVGTLSIPNGSTTVTGIGTLWLANVAVNDYILIGVSFMLISSVDSDTTITLDNTYNGEPLTGVSYVAQTMFTGATLKNFVVNGSIIDGILVRGCRKSIITSVGSIENATGIRQVNCGQNLISSSSANRNTADGVVIDSSYGIICNSVESFNNANDGFVLLGNALGTTVDSCQFNGNNRFGVSIQDTASATNISDCIVCYNNDKGFDSEPGTGTCIVSGCTVANSDMGIDFNGTANTITGNLILNNVDIGLRGGDNSVITGNHTSGNGGWGISLTVDSDCTVTGNVVENNGDDGIGGVDGDGNIISGNSVRNNAVNGIHIEGGDNNIITGNRITGNTGNGILIDAGSTDTIVTSNNMLLNTGTNYVDLGTTTTQSANKF
ncbi:MAG: right-handed parallel beta-helix repeat-containing protein [Gammaproteobacteria bacterium]|nr:right-handed parallel beta-helix repeat-containing protein [Gammaproteobacteria bacterium]